MLSQVRNTLKGPIAWLVVILLILAFALWGVPSASQIFASNSTLKVGDKNFSQQYIQTEFNKVFQRQSRESGGSLSREDAIANGMPNQVIDTIATRSVLTQFADKMNLAMPREAVRDYLQQNEIFQNPATGQFDRATLEGILYGNSITVEEFERQIKADLQRAQLIEAIAAGAPAADPFVDAILLRETERRRIAYLTVTDEMAGVAAEPGPDDLQAFYEQNESTFTAPEYRTFDMLLLRSADFREDLEAPEEELQRLYDAGKERLYDKPERRTIYQVTYETEAEALAAVASLRSGTPFENIASEKGMSLEAATFPEAQRSDILDPSVAEAAFADGLEEGSITDPIQSLFGWTVIQIAGLIPAETTTFEEVRDQLEEDYLAQDVRRRMLDAIDEIEEVRDTGAALADAAEAAGFSVETVGPIDRVSFSPGGAIIDKVPGDVLREAFALQEGDQSEALRLSSDDGYYIVGLKEITPPALKPFDYVRDEVEERWRNQERRDRISQTVTSIRTSVEAGESLEDVADTFNRAPIVTVIDRRFQNDVISASFNDSIFFADLNDVISGQVGNSGTQVVAEIREIGYAPSTIPPEQVDQFKQMIGYQLDQELVEAFVLSLREDYGVKLNQSQIDALFNDSL
ncbi:SurA N-terminal domain-containing protein [Hyphococcus flavus]|uniref:Parvulin-like PPIase n=1 Tax=Hyphococcus flavus TaxID=1866326 RepID=A0AAE9ZAX7_9PROT|nr:peptidylprolyl isomerase [Hyphococcus flavus]WDI31089.1 SurA N-terminal domain-containing protein [Hyphococcus flavus]